MVTIKKAEPLSDRRIQVNLEDEMTGKEFTFVGDAWEVLWDIETILIHWKEKVIPRSLEVEKMNDEEFKRRVRQLEGISI